MQASDSKLVVLIASLAMWAWLSLIAKHHMPVILFAQIGVFAIFTRVLWNRLRGLRVAALISLGGVIGFVSAIGAAAISEVLVRGVDGFLFRDFTQNIYFYPLVSFAWLYGIVILFALVGFRK